MQCPECGNEMRQGYIQCKQVLSWVKTPHWVSLRPEPEEEFDELDDEEETDYLDDEEEIDYLDDEETEEKEEK